MADKKVRCIGCGKVIANEAKILDGHISIDCRHCGTTNLITAKPREKVEITSRFDFPASEMRESLGIEIK